MSKFIQKPAQICTECSEMRSQLDPEAYEIVVRIYDAVVVIFWQYTDVGTPLCGGDHRILQQKLDDDVKGIPF